MFCPPKPQRKIHVTDVWSLGVGDGKWVLHPLEQSDRAQYNQEGPCQSPRVSHQVPYTFESVSEALCARLGSMRETRETSALLSPGNQQVEYNGEGSGTFELGT